MRTHSMLHLPTQFGDWRTIIVWLYQRNIWIYDLINEFRRVLEKFVNRPHAMLTTGVSITGISNAFKIILTIDS